ncbi:MAG: hypothetical protein WA091_02830 [Minisyncoccales bacterium]
MCRNLDLPITKQHELAARLWIALAKSQGNALICEQIFDTHPIIRYDFIRESIGIPFGNPKARTVASLIIAGGNTPRCIDKIKQHINNYYREGGEAKDFEFSEVEKTFLMVQYRLNIPERNKWSKHC